MFGVSLSLWRWFWRKITRMHWPLILLTIILAGTGIAMLYSAAGGEMNRWANPQMQRFWLGLATAFILAFINIRLLMFFIIPAYVGLVGLLVYVDLFGHVGMGAQRWINLGFMQLQPSEPMKLAVILMLARYFHRLNPEHIGRISILIPPLIMVAIPVILILRQPNLGTATILSLIAASILFAAGVRAWKFATVGGVALAAAPIAWLFLHDYQKERILTFLNPERDPLGSGYNILQSKIAIGSGGMTGKGFLQGPQSQLNFLPEKHTDFIFTMLAEEFGFIGGLLTLAAFTLLLVYCYLIALQSQHHFGRLVATGIASYFFFHICINIGMVMGLLPVVGVPLPFMSYGGTSLLTSMAAVGLLLNVHVNRNKTMQRMAGFG